MRRRLLIGIVIVTAGLAAFVLAFPHTASVFVGLVRHEAFFAGKPTNYWIRALKHEEFLGQAQPAGDIGKTLPRRKGIPAVSWSRVKPSPNWTLRRRPKRSAPC